MQLGLKGVDQGAHIVLPEGGGATPAAADERNRARHTDARQAERERGREGGECWD